METDKDAARNFVRVQIKKSSNTGKFGFDVDVQVADATEEHMAVISDIAYKKAMLLGARLSDKL